MVTSSIRDLEPFAALPAQLLDELGFANGVYVGEEDLVKVAAALEQAGVRAPCVGFGNTDLLQPYLARQTVSAVIDEHRYLQGYFAVQKAYEALLKRVSGATVSNIRVSSDVALAANATDSRDYSCGV